ncbi:MAG: hypothetical protein WCO10_03155 [bacterium]
MADFENNIITGSNEQKPSGMGGVVGAIIIIIVLIAGGWYFIGNRIDKISQPTSEVVSNEVTYSTSTLSTSSEIVDIQKDLDSLNLDSLGQ